MTGFLVAPWWVVHSTTGARVDIGDTFFEAVLRADALSRAGALHHVVPVESAPLARSTR